MRPKMGLVRQPLTQTFNYHTLGLETLVILMLFRLSYLEPHKLK